MRRPFVPSVPELAHATVSNTVRSSIDRLVWEPCRSYAVPCQGYSTSVGRHCSHHTQVSSIFTIHIRRLPLKKGCLEINVEKKKDPNFCWLLFENSRNPGLAEAGESVCKYSFCLSWNPLSTHLAFALRKLPCLSVSNGWYVILWFELPQINEVKRPQCQFRISTRCVSLQQTACSIFVLPGLTLLFVHEPTLGLLLLRLFHRLPCNVPACFWF